MATITGPLSLNDIEAALTRPVKASKTISTPNLISR